MIIIQEAHPLKQGLKHKKVDAQQARKGDSRGASTKTRIETFFHLSEHKNQD